MKLVSPTHSVLHRKADPVKFPDRGLSRLYADMLATMLENRGIGLAAPQVGLSLRLFTYLDGAEIGIIINPEIIQRSPELIETTEGCLTYPNEFWQVKRSKEITLDYYDLGGKRITRRMSGLMAVIAAHETDHCNGILISQIGQKKE